MKGELLHLKKVEIIWGTVGVKLPELMPGGCIFSVKQELRSLQEGRGSRSGA